MNKVTLVEYAKMTNQSIRSAVDTARQSNAIVLDNMFVYVDLDVIKQHTSKDTN